MNSQEIWNNITALTKNKAIHDFAEILKDEDNKETLLVGIEVIANAEDLILLASDGETLRTAVLSVAKVQGKFAGFAFVAEEHLDVEDENFLSNDEGLQWVAWGDLWDALEKVAQYNPIKE